jgi:hypothetical protein
MENNLLFLKFSKKFTIDQLFEISDVLDFTQQFVIVENFYETPELVRNYALDSFDYSIKFPYGLRSNVTYYNEDIFNKLNVYVNIFGSSITQNYNSFDNGSFLYVTKENNKNSWIHIDSEHHNWAGVIYMNKLKNTTFGTNFFIEYEKYSKNLVFFDENWFCNKNKFIVCDTIGNKFNKLVLYNSNIYHAIARPFGSKKNDCRISQTFFLGNV